MPLETILKAKQIVIPVISFAIGAALGGYFAWKSAAEEHKRLMRIEINNDYINSLSHVSTGKNATFSRQDFNSSVSECLENSDYISAQNSLPTGTFEIVGWKDYVANGIIGYTAVPALGKTSPIYACIMDSAGNLQETRLVLPESSPDQNLIRSVKESSLLEAEF